MSVRTFANTLSKAAWSGAPPFTSSACSTKTSVAYSIGTSVYKAARGTSAVKVSYLAPDMYHRASERSQPLAKSEGLPHFWLATPDHG